MLRQMEALAELQNMKTRLPVSSKRLEQQWLKVQQWVEHNPR